LHEEDSSGPEPFLLVLVFFLLLLSSMTGGPFAREIGTSGQLGADLSIFGEKWLRMVLSCYIVWPSRYAPVVHGTAARKLSSLAAIRRRA
jgi:hypothetical protein